MLKQLSLGALTVAALVLNPFYACVPEPSFQFTANEMAAAIEGTWTLTLEDRSYIFHIEAASARRQHSRASLVPSAHACGKRTVVKSAAACVDTTTLPVVVNVSGSTSDGEFRVHGTRFVEGELVIDVADHRVHARVNADGTATVHADKPQTLIRAAR
jgi:phage tail sheath gpL-like